MTLSVIIPVYNCKDYLDRCVSGLLELRQVEYEIILIDDGSTDGSGQCCDELADRYPVVRCIHQPNKGVSEARNRGIEEARGDYILFVDADDTLEIGLLLSLLEELRHEPSAEMAAFGMYFDYYRKGNIYRSDRVVCSNPGWFDRDEIGTQVRALFRENYLSPIWNKIMLRSVLVAAGTRFDPRLFLLEDLDFSLRYLANCTRILCADQAVYHYRQPEDEGNAARRLKRVGVISSVMAPLERSFGMLADHLGMPETEFRPILSEIYLMLAGQKIRVSDRKTIKNICDDFISWTRIAGIPEKSLTGKLPQRLLHRKVFRILLRRDYSKLRHWAGRKLRAIKSRS